MSDENVFTANLASDEGCPVEIGDEGSNAMETTGMLVRISAVTRWRRPILERHAVWTGDQHWWCTARHGAILSLLWLPSESASKNAFGAYGPIPSIAST
jgi:hypothetical protein